MIIRNVLPQDTDAIVKLNERFVKVLSPLNKTQLIHLIELSALAVVIEIDNQFAGFLLALNAKRDYKSINYLWFNQRYNEFLYIDRIVISQNHQGKGIASALYQYAINFAKSQSIPKICAEIDIQPPNETSLSFHNKLGFTELELLKHNEHKVVSLQVLDVM